MEELSKIDVKKRVEDGDGNLCGPFGLYPNFKKSCKALKIGSFEDIRDYLRGIGISLSERPGDLTGWHRNNWKDYSVSVTYGLG